MNCSIENVYTKEKCKTMAVEQKIRERVKEYQSNKSNEYIIKSDSYEYQILSKPKYKLNWFGKLLLKFEFDYKYKVLSFDVRNGQIITQARSDDDVKKAKSIISKIFGDIEGLEHVIRKYYCTYN